MQMRAKNKPRYLYFYQKKIDFKTKAKIRDKEGHYKTIKGSIQQEDRTLVNIYAPNIRTLKYIK